MSYTHTHTHTHTQTHIVFQQTKDMKAMLHPLWQQIMFSIDLSGETFHMISIVFSFPDFYFLTRQLSYVHLYILFPTEQILQSSE